MQHTGVRDKDNKTPLHYACRGGEKDVLVYLVGELKCDIGEFIPSSYHFNAIRK